MQDKTKEEILKTLKTQETGLTTEEALQRLKTEGKMSLQKKKKKIFLQCLQVS